MKRDLKQILAALLLLAVAAGAFHLFVPSSGPQMVSSAEKFLGSLSDDQRKVATMQFDDAARLKWHFIPLPERKGLQIKNMSEAQRTAAHDLLKAGLSQIGYGKATTIMSLEAILRELEKNKVGGAIRDPERYYFTIFGSPKSTGQWGWSVEGHHLSLNFVVRDGQVASHTPSFLGCNPATVRNEIAGQAKIGTRVLAKEEDLGFELLKSLKPEQRSIATIAAKAPKELRGAGEPQPPQTAPEGLAAKDMTDAQIALLRALLETYNGNMPADIGTARMAEIDQAGFDKLYFAWAGADEPGIGHYYRVQGPTFLLEFCNTQPDSAGSPANHIHTSWRDVRGDFGLPIK